MSVLVFLVAFVLAGLVKPILILVGAIDFAGALWTTAAAKRSARGKVAAAGVEGVGPVRSAPPLQGRQLPHPATTV